MGGKQLRLFLVDGTPGGLTTLEITNWTGRLVGASRSDLLKRDEAQRPGIYVLLGDDPEAIEGQRLYVGETDEIRGRLRQHNDSTRGKDFWTRVVIVTSKDDNLTKAHTRYLESRLATIATAAKRCTLENNTSPGTPTLPEADVSDMEYFIDQLHIALPVLGLNVLRGAATPTLAKSAPDALSPIFALTIPKRGIAARAQQIDGEFTVLEGSTVAGDFAANETYADSTKASYAAYRAQHAKLVADGSIVVNGATGSVTRDVRFPSPSAAGAIVSGRSCNGRKAWESSDGLSFGAWEDRDL